MSDGILSQDEIDALIGGGSRADEGADHETESAESAGDFDISAVGEILRLAMNATVEGLAIMTGVEGRLEAKGVHEATLGELRDVVAGEVVAVECELAGAIDGILVSLFPPESAALLSEIGRGGEASDGEDGEELSGFREAVAEIALHLSDAIASALDVRVELSPSEPVRVSWEEDVEPPFPMDIDEPVVFSEFELALGDAKCTVMHLIPLDVATSMLATFEQGEALAGSRETAAAQEPSVVSRAARPAMRRTSEDSGIRGRAGFGGTIAPAHFQELGGERSPSYPGNIELLLDVPLQVTVELGRTRMQIREVLELGKGSIIELEKLAGEPVEIFVNGKLIAKGEVVTIDENFGVKITDIVSLRERMSNLQ